MNNDIQLNELYQQLSPAIRDEISRYEEQAVVPAGTKLISQNVLPEHLLVIQQGTVEISVPGEQETIFRSVAGKGRVLGLRSILAGTPPEIEATTLEECTILRIPTQSFLGVLKQHPVIYLAVCKVLNTDIHTAVRFLRNAPARHITS